MAGSSGRSKAEIRYKDARLKTKALESETKMMREALEARERELEGSREVMVIHWEIVENASDGSNSCPSLVTLDGSGEEGRGKIFRAKEKGREEEKEEESDPSRMRTPPPIRRTAIWVKEAKKETKRAKEKEEEKGKQTVQTIQTHSYHRRFSPTQQRANQSPIFIRLTISAKRVVSGEW